MANQISGPNLLNIDGMGKSEGGGSCLTPMSKKDQYDRKNSEISEFPPK